MKKLASALVALALLSGCVTGPSDATSTCTNDAVSMQYVDTISVKYGVRAGRFNVTNNGPTSIAMRLAQQQELQLYSADTAPLVRSEGGAWENYNIRLDELMPPAGEVKLDPGQSAVVSFDMNGAFLPANLSDNLNKQFLLDLRLKDGCTIRSAPFEVFSK